MILEIVYIIHMFAGFHRPDVNKWSFNPESYSGGF